MRAFMNKSYEWYHVNPFIPTALNKVAETKYFPIILAKEPKIGL